jgi:uncharacterized protein
MIAAARPLASTGSELFTGLATDSKIRLVDSRVIVNPKGNDVIKSRLSQPWKHRFRMRDEGFYVNPSPRKDRNAPKEPNELIENHLHPHKIRQAILMPKARVSENHDPDYATAVAAAYNDWLADVWLAPAVSDFSLHGSITIAHQDPAAAATEVRRRATDRRFVQVVMDSGSRNLFGQRQYHPIYEACAEANLPLAIQPGSDGLGVNTLACQGYPSYYLEYYTSFSLTAQAHLVSLLTEGVFEKFPKLKIVFLESGFAWLPPIMWRLDQEYKGLRAEVPWLHKRPSEYLKDHVRFTTEPLERPQDDADLLEVLEMMNGSELLLFASNYPEGEFDRKGYPDWPQETAERIFSGNALQWYSLDRK